MHKRHVGEGRAAKVKFLRWFPPPALALRLLSWLRAVPVTDGSVRAARSQGPPSWTTAASHVAPSLSPGKEGGAFFGPRAAPDTLLRVASPITPCQAGGGAL